MTQWYYGTKDNQQCGPVEASVILEKLRTNELTRDSFVWREGMAQWQRIWTLMDELETPASSSFSNNAPITLQTNHYTASVTTDTATTTSRHNGGGNHETTSTSSPYAAPISDLASTAAEVVYVGFWRRAAAALVDNMLIGIFGQFLGAILGAIAGNMIATSQKLDPNSVPVGGLLVLFFSFVLTFALYAIYYAWFYSSSKAATPGKMLVGIKVVRPDGERITFLRGIGRFFATFISSIILNIGYIMAAFTDQKQALHDMICDTRVVDKWAFTDHHPLQQRGLGTAAIVILSVFFVILFISFIFIIIAIGSALANS